MWSHLEPHRGCIEAALETASGLLTYIFFFFFSRTCELLKSILEHFYLFLMDTLIFLSVLRSQLPDAACILWLLI